jgi:hypothetical protein
MVQQSRFMLAFFVIALLAISFASASDSVIFSSLTVPETVYTLDQSSVTGSINVQCIGENESKNISVSISSNLSLSISNQIVTLNCSSNQTSKVSFTISNLLNQDSQLVLLSLTGNSSINDTMNLVKVYSRDPLGICGAKYASQNISFGDVEDNEAENEDEWEWMPSNKISITVNDVYNKVDDDEKFDVYLLFYQGTTRISGSKIVSDDDNLDNKDLRIDGEDEENAEFEFNVASDADSGNYDMYVKVEGKYGCYVEKLSKQISIDTEEDDYSIVSDVDGPTSSSCGETVDLTATVSNIGDEDAEKVKVSLYNKELGLNLFKEIENLDQGDESVVSFSFAAPQNAIEKSYKLLLYTEFGYDEDDEEYIDESGSEYDYTYTLSLSGNCVDPTKPIVTAKLNSTSAIVGEEVVVAVAFKNNGNTSVSAILSPEDFESWAELVSVEPATITVGRAESKTVYMTFKPIKEGTQTFNLNAIYNGKSMDQAVTLSVDANTGLMSYLKEQLGSTGAYLALGIAVLIALILLVLVIKLVLWLVRKH